MNETSELTSDLLIRFTQIDYDREMALLATVDKGAKENMIGIARYYTQADRDACEFAIAVAEAWQNKGVATHMMTSLIEIAKAQGIKTMSGRILADNAGMLALAQHLGFVQKHSDDPAVKLVSLTF